MGSYKCNSCEYEWTSEEEPFNCPECSSSDFKEVGKSKKGLPLKAIGIGLGALLFFIILVNMCSGAADMVQVNAKQDNSKATLTVVLENYDGIKSKDFKISIKNKDGVEQDSKRSAKATFSRLEGTYTLEVRYLGKEEGVQIDSYKRTFTFPELPKAITILQLKADRSYLAKPTDTYTLTVVVDDTENAEYQLDGGAWQKSNTFADLRGKEEEYRVVVRNGLAPDNTSLYDEKSRLLKPYKKEEPLTLAQVKDLLRKVANYDDAAYDRLLRKVGASTPVVGAKNISTLQHLANAVNNGESYRVVDVEYDSTKSHIVKIRVK